jgi:hypothetical protein
MGREGSFCVVGCMVDSYTTKSYSGSGAVSCGPVDVRRVLLMHLLHAASCLRWF